MIGLSAKFLSYIFTLTPMFVSTGHGATVQQHRMQDITCNILAANVRDFKFEPNPITSQNFTDQQIPGQLNNDYNTARGTYGDDPQHGIVCKSVDLQNTRYAVKFSMFSLIKYVDTEGGNKIKRELRLQDQVAASWREIGYAQCT